MRTIVADGASDAPVTMQREGLPGLVSPPIPEVVAAWNELTREKLAGGI